MTAVTSQSVTFSVTQFSLPAWAAAMTAGTVANFTTNTVDSVKPTGWTSPTGNISGMFYAWNGAAFASELGSHGSVLFHGGGHNDYDGNEVYRLDINSGTWSRLCQPTPVTVGGNTYLDGPTGDIKTAYGGGTGVIAALHTYLASFYVPPSAAGTSNGYFCVGPTNSGSGKGYVHKFSLDGTGTSVSANTLWSRASENTIPGSGAYGYYPSACWDSTRNRLWYVNQGSYQTRYFNWATGTVTATAAWTNTQTTTTPIAYSPTIELIVLWQNVSGSGSLQILDPDSPTTWRTVAQNGTKPANANYLPLIWCEDLGCFLTYTGAGSKVIYKLTPPADPVNGTWQWTSETFTGVTPPYTANGPLTKFQYAPEAKCAIYADGHLSAAVAFRLTGA